MEWIVDIQNMIPMGQIGERMVVARRDDITGRYSVMQTPTLKAVSINESIGDDGVFMLGHGSGLWQGGEINKFLQAMMEAGWKRGIRPSGFDPSAGEPAAVN